MCHEKEECQKRHTMRGRGGGVEAASGPRALREYALLHPERPEAKAGLGGIWSVHLARPKRQGEFFFGFS